MPCGVTRCAFICLSTACLDMCPGRASLNWLYSASKLDLLLPETWLARPFPPRVRLPLRDARFAPREPPLRLDDMTVFCCVCGRGAVCANLR